MDDLQTFGVSAHSQFELLGKHLEERKRVQSLPLPSAILVAESTSEGIPPRFAFRQVSVQEVDTKQITFVDKVPPRTNRMTVLIAGGEQPVYLAARVVHFHDCQDAANDAFLVGCEFTQRLSPPTLAASK